MSTQKKEVFTKRERQIMDIVYSKDKMTARQIQEAMDDAPSYTSVRTHLRLMIEKGYLEASQEGVRYAYSPVVPRSEAKDSALKNLIKTFFGGSSKELIATLVTEDSKNMSSEQLDQISELIEQAKRRER